MRKVRALLYYVYTTTYNQINYNYPRVLIMHFYRLLQFHTRRRFCTGLYIRVSNSGHPITYVRQFCTNKTGRKIYRCIPARSTQHHMLLNNLTILHTKKVFVPACHPLKKISSKTKYHSLHCCTHACLTCHRPLQNTIQTHIQVLRTTFIF